MFEKKPSKNQTIKHLLLQSTIMNLIITSTFCFHKLLSSELTIFFSKVKDKPTKTNNNNNKLKEQQHPNQTNQQTKNP